MEEIEKLEKKLRIMKIDLDTLLISVRNKRAEIEKLEIKLRELRKP